MPGLRREQPGSNGEDRSRKQKCHHDLLPNRCSQQSPKASVSIVGDRLDRQQYLPLLPGPLLVGRLQNDEINFLGSYVKIGRANLINGTHRFA